MAKRPGRKARATAKRRRSGRPWALAALALAAVAAVALWRLREPPGSAAPVAARPTVAEPRPTFVGSAACTGCHPEEAARWQASQHRRAMEPASDATVRGAFDGSTFSYAGTTHRFRRDGDRFLLETDGADGVLAEHPVEYTFGLDPVQQVLVPQGGGRLQAPSLAWDARPREVGGQRWFHLYPDERIDAKDPLHWTRPAQNWNHVCADCHATGLRKRFDASTDRFDTRWAELGVGCEGCHGPGSAHVGWAATPERDRPPGGPRLRAPLDERRGVHWSIDPSTGSAKRSAPRETEREIEVCAQCHARRSSLTESYEAGERFLDHYRPALLERPLYHVDGQQRDEVYDWGSFLQSRMYDQGVTCSDCHDPHSGKLRAAASAVCSNCHAPEKFAATSHHHHVEGSPGADCVACHMPTTTYMVIDPRHDHSLRVPRPDRSVTLGTPNACNACHADRTAVWAADRLRAWLGRDPAGHQRFAEALHAADASAVSAGPELRAIAGDPAQPAIARATALASLDASSGRASLAALAAGARSESPLVRFGAVQGLGGAPTAERIRIAAPLLSDPLRAIRLEAARALADAGPGLPPERHAPFERAAAELVASLRLDADRAESRTLLGSFLAQRGDGVGAVAELRAATAIEPSFVPAYVNLADVHRAAGREQDAEQVLRAGLAVAPENAALHHALGLSLVRSQRLPEALVELARAAELEPASARYAYVYGIGLHSTGRTDEAILVLEGTLAEHPNDRSVLEALASLHRERGELERSQAYVDQLTALAAAEQ